MDQAFSFSVATMWIIPYFAIAALCGRVHSADVGSTIKSSDDEGRPRRLIPLYYTPGNSYDPLLQDEYIRQQGLRQQERQDRKYNNDEYIRQHETQGRKDYNMVAGYSYTNGESQQFFKQYLPEAASSYQTPSYIKYVTDNSPKSLAPSPIPAPIPKFKPLQPAAARPDYYVPTAASQPNDQYVVVNDNVQYYYRPNQNIPQQQLYKYLHVQSTPVPAPTPLYNLVSTVQPQQYQEQDQYPGQYPTNANQAQYPGQNPTNANQAQYQDNNQVQNQENTNQAQYHESSEEQNYQDSRDQPQYHDPQQYQNNPDAYQQYLLEFNKHAERQYLPLQDKLVTPIQYQAQTQYQSPVAGQYQSETYPTTNDPLGSHRFAPTQQPTQEVKQTDPRVPSKVTSVTIQKSQELPLKNSYSENDDSHRDQSFQYPTKPTKLQKVRPTPTQTTESYYPYEHLQPFVENMKYANQQSKPSPFQHAQSPVNSAQPFYGSSTTPLYPSTPFVGAASVTPKKQNVKIISDNDEEQGGKSPFDFLKSFQLGKEQNYEIPLTSFTGPAKENTFSTTKKPQTSHTKTPSAFYDPYLKLIKSSSNKINPTNTYKTQRPRPEEVAVTTQQSILPPHEEQKYRENIGALTQILKGHQINKALPEKVTADNIDSSIDTLTTILKVLQKNPGGFSVPQAPVAPVKSQHFPYTGSLDNSLTVKTHAQTYTDGGTPGRPGIDYPNYTEIPETQFNCKTQRYKGFFGDPETDCQVWHYCDLNGGQASFLCPNGTIFSQVALTCDWWFNVRCNNTAQLYVLNERLYKFILPTKPSFPEDYSGPEVDEYLTQKFYESESKRKPDNETEASVSPGTTTEPVQSNDLNDNYLRRRDVYQVQPVPADRRHLEVDGEVEYEEVDTEPRDPIDGLTSSSDRDEVFVDSRGKIIVSSDISINRRDVSRELPDITSVGRDSSPQLKEASANSADSSQLRDLTTQLRTWR